MDSLDIEEYTTEYIESNNGKCEVFPTPFAVYLKECGVKCYQLNCYQWEWLYESAVLFEKEEKRNAKQFVVKSGGIRN